MDVSSLARTLEARLDELDLAKTLVRDPRATIRPRQRPSTGGGHAVDALREASGSLDGKLSIVSPLGEGGMGLVHLATQATVGRHVAVKTLRAAGDPEAGLRLLREAWVTGALEHPNVVPIYDVGVDAAGSPVIVMKRVEGRSWADLLQAPDELARLVGESDALEANLRVLHAVCNALHFAHSKGILHRDIKPENVMIGAFGEVYVLDWGIAVSLRDDPSGRLPPAAQATEIAGTPGYMAPEMLLGDPDALSPRTDVYLLGATLYEVFTGSPPHQAASLEAMLGKVLLSQPAFEDGFPAEARALCERAMARDPAARFGSVDELRAALEEYRRHRGSRKIAREARASLDELLRTLTDDPPGDERTLAVFNLLGECRFGFRAALSAWPGNEAARRGLDRALVSVAEHEVVEGDPQAASLLLREVAQPPPALVARIDEALRARAADDERRRKLEIDHDPLVGARTRAFIILLLGGLWSLTPLVGWAMVLRGSPPSFRDMHVVTVGVILLAFGLWFWARDTLGKTLLNRRLVLTVTVHFVMQAVLILAADLAGLSTWQAQVLHMFSWALTQGLLSLWVEPWLAASAMFCVVAFLAASAYPPATYPLMSLANLVMTVVLVRVWAPRQYIEQVHGRRAALRRGVRKVFLDLARRRGLEPEA